MITAKQVIEIYRGWDALERPGGVEIIDFDLIPQIKHRRSFGSRKEVLSHLIELRGNCEVKPKRQDEEFLKARIQASVWYLRALMGELIPFPLYVANLVGIRPHFIPESVINSQREKLAEIFRELGVPHKKSFKQLSEDLRMSQREAEKESKRAEELYLPQVLGALGWEDMPLQYKIKFVKEEAYWSGWSRTQNGEFELRYNFHPMHLWLKGDMEFLVLHEIAGHFVQMANIRETIRAGAVNPALGLTTVHDPHSFGAEGAADALSCFLNIPLSPFGILAREQRVLRNYLNNNAHIKANLGADPEELARHILEVHPFLTEKKVRMNIRNWVQNPTLRAYQYSYGIADFYHRILDAELNPEQKRTYLRWVLSRMATPNQIVDYLRKMRQ